MDPFVEAVSFRNDIDMDSPESISVHVWMSESDRKAAEIERWLESPDSGFRWTPKGYK